MRSADRYRSLLGRSRLVSILLIVTGLLLVCDTVYIVQACSTAWALYRENQRLEQARTDAPSARVELALAIDRDLLYYQIPDRFLARNLRDRVPVWLGLTLSLVAWLRWQFRAHRNLGAFWVPNLRYPPNLAVVGWLLPGANLVLPLLTMRELWQASQPSRPDAGWRQAGAVPVHLWWGTSLAWIPLYALASLLLVRPDGQQVQLALYVMMASDVLALFGLLLGWHLIASVGRWQSARQLSRRGFLGRTVGQE